MDMDHFDPECMQSFYQECTVYFNQASYKLATNLQMLNQL